MAEQKEIEEPLTAQENYNILSTIIDKYALTKMNISLVETRDHCDELKRSFEESFDFTPISNISNLKSEILSYMFEQNDFKFMNILEFHTKIIIENDKTETQKINPFQSLKKKNYKLLYGLLKYMNVNITFKPYNTCNSFDAYQNMVAQPYSHYHYHGYSRQSKLWPIKFGYKREDLLNGILEIKKLVDIICETFLSQQIEQKQSRKDKIKKLLKCDIYCVNVPICSVEQMYYGSSYWNNHKGTECWKYIVLEFDNQQNSQIYICANVCP